MDIADIIDMIDTQRTPALLFAVFLEDFCQKPLNRETVQFFNKEDVIPFLFDKDIFGWQVKSWNFTQFATGCGEVVIELYRFNNKVK